jgi:hypothetical protein
VRRSDKRWSLKQTGSCSRLFKLIGVLLGDAFNKDGMNAITHNPVGLKRAEDAYTLPELREGQCALSNFMRSAFGVRYVLASLCVFASAAPAPVGEPALWKIQKLLVSKKYVDLTHDFAPGIPRCPGFPDETRELLTNLDQVPEAGAIAVVSFPKPKGGSGFPARVFAVLP